MNITNKLINNIKWPKITVNIPTNKLERLSLEGILALYKILNMEGDYPLLSKAETQVFSEIIKL
jgi:hypothetical protein